MAPLLVLKVVLIPSFQVLADVILVSLVDKLLFEIDYFLGVQLLLGSIESIHFVFDRFEEV